MRLRRVGLAAVVWAALGSAEAGHLVVSGDGRTMPIEGFRFEGDRVRLEFGGGGEIAVPVASLARIERAPEAPPVEPEPLPVGFSADHVRQGEIRRFCAEREHIRFGVSHFLMC